MNDIAIKILTERNAPKTGVPIAERPILEINLVLTRDLDDAATPMKQDTSICVPDKHQKMLL